MASQINPEVFPDNVKVNKADLREQFEIAANEISALQNVTSPAISIAYDDDSFNSL